MYRVTLDGASLRADLQWFSRIDQVPGELSFVEIEWHDINDMSALGSQAGETSQPAEPDAAGGEEPLPEDGDSNDGYWHANMAKKYRNDGRK